MVKDSIVSLIRLGLGYQAELKEQILDWPAIQTFAINQGVLGIVMDGIERLSDPERPPKELLHQWIGLVMHDEAIYMHQKKTAEEIALLFHENGLLTYVLKGFVVSECYHRPERRVSSDLDCFLLPEHHDVDAWSVGNDLIKRKGIKVSTDYYKNSTLYLPGLVVENHRYMVPFRGNKILKDLENTLQGLLKKDNGEDRFEGTWLCRPPLMVSALFLIEHSYSHFLHEGLTWRHIIDWMMFKKKHSEEIDWVVFESLIDKYGFRSFYDSFIKLGCYLLGEINFEDLNKRDKRMLDDVWAPLDVHETVHGVKGKLGLVGNTFRAWWKYHYFSEISMLHALWIQVYGFVFDKNPVLN